MNDGGPAFPRLETLWSSLTEHPDYSMQCSMGMTLRDYFAAKALEAIVNRVFCGDNQLSSALAKAAREMGCSDYPEFYAKSAYQLADAMLKQRSL